MTEGRKLRVGVCGAAGRMGREVVKAVLGAPDMELVAAVDVACCGQDAGTLAGCAAVDVKVASDLADALAQAHPDAIVDFTVPASAMGNIRTALAHRVRPVVGTTGLTPANLKEVAGLVAEAGVGAVIAPNFAIGAVLLMQFAAQAARYLPDAEIIELHHDRKLDSPSGTAMTTAAIISAARQQAPTPAPNGTVEKAAGARGARVCDVPVHSVRLQGFVAHQEVIFGAPGQTLTIRHDSTDRCSFMPGVLLAVRKVVDRTDLVVGLEHLL